MTIPPQSLEILCALACLSLRVIIPVTVGSTACLGEYLLACVRVRSHVCGASPVCVCRCPRSCAFSCTVIVSGRDMCCHGLKSCPVVRVDESSAQQVCQMSRRESFAFRLSNLCARAPPHAMPPKYETNRAGVPRGNGIESNAFACVPSTP